MLRAHCTILIARLSHARTRTRINNNMYYLSHVRCCREFTAQMYTKLTHPHTPKWQRVNVFCAVFRVFLCVCVQTNANFISSNLSQYDAVAHPDATDTHTQSQPPSQPDRANKRGARISRWGKCLENARAHTVRDIGRA